MINILWANKVSKIGCENKKIIGVTQILIFPHIPELSFLLSNYFF
jgi:hypothetical protein